MRIRHTRRATGTMILLAALQAACGDDAAQSPADDADSDPKLDAGDVGSDAGASEDAAQLEDTVLALDVALDADATAKELCGFTPWVLGSLNERQLSASKIKNVVRDELQAFIDDKPPICLDDADSEQDLCIESPSEAETYTYLYRAADAVATDPVEQVWCKSDSFADLALIKGAEQATKGSCETLQGMVVTWAEAQLSVASTRSVRYEASLLMTGSAWTKALVTTREEGDVLVVTGPELYAPTKAAYIEENGMVLSILQDDFFGNHYCKVLSPAQVLAWLQGP